MDKQQEFLLNRIKVGQLLKAIREKNGFSQKEMSRQAGYANASFVCFVEKGTSTVPMNKIEIFAENYMPEEKTMLAKAICRKLHPDHWEFAVNTLLQGTQKTPKKETQEIDTWFEQTLHEYGVNI